jgi:hypothetical protein
MVTSVITPVWPVIAVPVTPEETTNTVDDGTRKMLGIPVELNATVVVNPRIVRTVLNPTPIGNVPATSPWAAAVV